MSSLDSVFQPETLRKIARCELRARQVVEGLRAGRHAGNRYGHAALFREHRPYATGDDPRHIDWKVWARSDRLCVKQYDTETNVNCLLLVDRSRSMAYGGQGGWTKYDCAATLAASLAWLAVRHQDTAGCLFFDKRAERIVPMKSQTGHALALANALDREAPLADAADGVHEEVNPEEALETALLRFPRKGLVLLFSDCFMDREALASSLRSLRGHGRQVVLFQIVDKDELELPFQGSFRFCDLESSSSLVCNSRLIRKEYQRIVRESLSDLRHTCAKSGIDYFLVRTCDPVDVPLCQYLYEMPVQGAPLP
ncbi:MAG: DUF58 domain-containing protein [Planctomycetia bacterium]|nr:DUF58 domain-containing protein [Planctomycetia bacterium]